MRDGSKSTVQLDLFGAKMLRATAALLREEARFGKWDARTGLSRRNKYSEQLTGDRLAAYEVAFQGERARG